MVASRWFLEHMPAAQKPVLPVLTAESLLKDRSELPLVWEAQHRVLRFPFPT